MGSTRMNESSDLGELKAELEQLAASVAEGAVGSSTDLWGGADVVISRSELPEPGGAFYPAPRQHYDGQTKVEFFGRLANAALRYEATRREQDALGGLLSAVLHEAFAIAEEMEEGTFRSLSVATGNEILDDYIDQAERNGFVGIEETRRFFAAKGIDV